MNDIEKSVNAAIGEFGKLAFERFTHKGMAFCDENCRSNKFLLSMMGVNNIKLKPLPDLYMHDVTIYGDDAHQMWRYKTKCGMQPACSNVEVERAIRYGLTIERKQSAELPFDIERAKAGDEVEWTAFDGTRYDVDFVEKHDEWRTLVNWKNKNNGDLLATDLLKMKYPSKLKVQS